MKLGVVKKIPFTFLFLGVLFAFALVPSVYYFTKYQDVSRKLAGAKKDDVGELVKRLSAHILLPEGETPTIMTVTDKEKLSGQAFFSHADNGDKVLIYEKAKKAFLYDLDRDLVLEVGPVTFGVTPTPAAAAPVATVSATPDTSPLRVYLYNGTRVVGLTNTYEKTLKKAFPDAIIVDRDNAASNAYEESVIVDLTGSNTSQAAQVAKTLGLTVSPLPAGEEASSAADFLIILGGDKK